MNLLQKAMKLFQVNKIQVVKKELLLKERELLEKDQDQKVIQQGLNGE